MSMDTERKRHYFLGSSDAAADVGSQAASVGVAQNDYVCSSCGRGLDGSQGIIRVRGKSIEKVLSIVDHLASLRFHISYRVTDESEIPVEWNLQCCGYMKIPRLSKNSDG